MQIASTNFNNAAVKGTRSSSAIISFGVFDVTAKDDATPTVNTSQSFTSIADILDDKEEPTIKIATFEDDYFKLDGTFYLVPDDISAADKVGWLSASQSDINKVFAISPTITLNFSANHSSIGLGVIFDESSYCTDFNIDWYNGSTLLESLAVTGNTSYKYYCEESVENYNKIVITLLKTDKPFRYARLLEVNFGLETVFDDSKIVSGNLIEEVDPIGATLSINKIKVTILNENQVFNMLNPEGVYAYLQKRQPIKVKSGLQLIDGSYEYVKMGTYYLSDWKNSNGLTATLEATDRIGLLDKTIYYASPFWADAPLDTVINHILNDTGLYIPFTIAPELADEVVNGYIPIMSHREALQTVLLGARGSLRIDRDDSFYIFKPNYIDADLVIDYDVIIGTPSIEQKPIITSVEANEYSYVLNSVSEQLHQSTFTLNGTSTIVIPYEAAASAVSLVVTGNGTISGSPIYSATSVIATIIGTGSLTVTVTGKKYLETKKIVKSIIPSLPAGEIAQTATIADNKIISGGSKASNITQYILDYYQLRIKQIFDFMANPALQAGDCVEVETMFNSNKKGVVTKQEVIFAPNLKAKLEVVG